MFVGLTPAWEFLRDTSAIFCSTNETKRNITRRLLAVVLSLIIANKSGEKEQEQERAEEDISHLPLLRANRLSRICVRKRLRG
jgi:hypothetical protein